MKISSRRRWTRAEKWLLCAPVLVGILGMLINFWPEMVRRKMGYPTELPTPKANLLLSAVLSDDGRVLASGAAKWNFSPTGVHTISFWDAHTLAPLSPMTRPIVRTPNGFDGGTYSLALSPDASLVAWSSDGQLLVVAERKTSKILWQWQKSGLAKGMTFSPDGKWLATNVAGGFRISQARTGRTISQWQCVPFWGGPALAFSPDGSLFASAGARPEQWLKKPNEFGGAIEVRSTRDWKVRRALSLPNTEFVAFSPDGRLIGINRIQPNPSGKMGAQMRCFDVATGRVLWAKQWEVDRVGELAGALAARFSPDGKTVALLTISATRIHLFDARTGQEKPSLHIPPAQQPFCPCANSPAWSPDGQRLFARGKDAVLVWDLD